MKVKVKSEKYLDGIFKRCFSHNPAVLFSPFFPAIWWPFYILLPFIALDLLDEYVFDPFVTTTILDVIEVDLGVGDTFKN